MARLVRTLGSELISSERVALIELVKNSFDADATSCVISFRGSLEEGEGLIEVLDDGHGMGETTLKNVWLDLATAAKTTNRKSPRGRRLLGEKGVGRLAASRLASDLLLTTKHRESDEAQMLIDWSAFDRPNAYLDEIEVAWSVGESKDFLPNGRAEQVFEDAGLGMHALGQGTSLIMRGLSRTWKEEEVSLLISALSRLIRPGQDAELEKQTNQFQISVNFPPPLTHMSGPIGPSAALQDPLYQLSGTVDQNGIGTLTYTQRDPSMVLQLQNCRLWTDKRRPPECGSFTLDIKVWDRDRAGIAMAAPGMGVRDFRRLLDPLAGVSLYRDGFRVFPFGEHGDDWLGLDLRRVQNPTLRLSNNQVIGNVFITTHENQNLRDQSNREGLQEGAPYEDLRTLLRAAMAEIETRRRQSRQAHIAGEGTSRGGVFDRFDLSDLRTALTDKSISQRDMLAVFDATDRNIQEGVKRIQGVITQYQLLATLGQLVDQVIHDGRSAVGAIRTKLRLLETARSRGNTSSVNQALQKLTKTTEVQADQLERLFNQLDPFSGRKRGRPALISLHDIIYKAIDAVNAQEHVIVDVDGEDATITADTSEILAIFVNLLNNSIYWVSQQSTTEPGRVQIKNNWRSDGALEISVSDSGPGVPPAFREDIFSAYFSTKPDGTGLGLAIVGSLVSHYGGEFTYNPNGPMSGGSFTLTLRRRV